jgi:SAM-dependent methyltransferase
MSEQSEMWNGPSGRAWVELQELLDGLFAPIERLLADAVAEAAPATLLDVGCGTGATTLAYARRLGEAAACTGADLSAPMLALARERAAREGLAVEFVEADAQRHAFPPGRFELFVSRFGVMFFDDSVRAFANLRRAARADSQLRCIVWRSPEENPFMTTAERAAAPLLPSVPPRVPDAPGQFGFANAQRVRRILEESGWVEIDIQPIDVECTMPASELTRYAARFGPLGRVLDEADERTRDRVVKTVRTAFEPFVHGTEVRYNAACWMLSAGVP